jgi:hypothetical protein
MLIRINFTSISSPNIIHLVLIKLLKNTNVLINKMFTTFTSVYMLYRICKLSSSDISISAWRSSVRLLICFSKWRLLLLGRKHFEYSLDVKKRRFSNFSKTPTSRAQSCVANVNVFVSLKMNKMAAAVVIIEGK